MIQRTRLGRVDRVMNLHAAQSQPMASGHKLREPQDHARVGHLLRERCGEVCRLAVLAPRREEVTAVVVKSAATVACVLWRVDRKLRVLHAELVDPARDDGGRIDQVLRVGAESMVQDEAELAAFQKEGMFTELYNKDDTYIKRNRKYIRKILLLINPKWVDPDETSHMFKYTPRGVPLPMREVSGSRGRENYYSQ